jgi:hypothetical protein
MGIITHVASIKGEQIYLILLTWVDRQDSMVEKCEEYVNCLKSQK